MVPSKVHRSFSRRWWVYMGYLTVAGPFHWLMDSYTVERIPCTQHSLKRSTGLGLTTLGRYFVTTKLAYTMQSLIHGPTQHCEDVISTTRRHYGDIYSVWTWYQSTKQKILPYELPSKC